MKTSLQRIITKDGLELQGLLFEPDKKTANVLVHIHGWVGNFYEHKFIDFIAKEATSKGFSFLTFNNRGAGIVNNVIQRKKINSYVIIGGSLEEFKYCVFDIGAVMNFLENKGYKNIVLQGHSLGCQKATFYEYKTKDKRVKGLILLAPVDDVSLVKAKLKNKYNKSLNIAKKMIKNGKGDSPVPEWMAFYPLLSAKMFLNIADPKSDSGRLFDREGDLKEIKGINLPILVVFGSKEDDYQLNPVNALKLLREKNKNCKTKLIHDSGHGFTDFEKQLSKLIANWLKNI